MKLADFLAWMFPAITPLYIIKNKAPDTSGMNQAAVDAAALNKEQLAWFKEVYAKEAPMREEAAALNRDVAAKQMEGMDFAMAQARELDDYNKTTFRPLEQRLVSEAQQYDTQGRREQAAAAAAADVDMNAAAVRAAQNRELGRAGIAPGTAKALAVAEDRALGQGGQRASAMTNAVRNVQQQGYARMMDAASLGRGLPGQQATQQQIASNTGGAAVGANNAGLGAATSGNAFMAQGYGQGMQGQQAVGGLYGNLFNAQRANNLDRLTFANANMKMGSDIGTAIAGLSDINVKSGTGKMADASKALKEVESVPVHEGWKYDPAKGGPDDGGVPHTGPMAQDVAAKMGPEASDGHTLNLVDMNGKMMAAIQELSAKVKKLERKAA